MRSPNQTPKLSIGVLAHNEEANIGQMLRSLFQQDVFERQATETVIVVNGSTDRTALIAEKALEDYRSVWSVQGSARVERIKLAGKANAWNEFVHRMSSPQTSFLILADADIEFLTSDTISSMVTTLEHNPHAVICVDRPVKDIEIKAELNFLERLLLASTPKIDRDNIPLCGQLYCALSAQLRLIKLPLEITVDDGFLRALLLTQGFTKPEDLHRIILDEGASHKFASVANLREIFKHEKWVVAGNIVNSLLFQRFWAEARPDRSAMTLMSRWHAHDPHWLPRFIQTRVKERGWDLLPRECWTRRWSKLRGLSTGEKIRRLPFAAMAMTIDTIIYIAAIRDVRRGKAYGYWGRVK